jgi:streptogramin lyase
MTGRITEYPVQDSPAAIVAGTDGGLWFNTFTDGRLGNVAGFGHVTTTGQVTEFYVHETCRANYHGLAVAADGALLFTEATGPVAVGRLDPEILYRTGVLGEERDDLSVTGLHGTAHATATRALAVDLDPL